jgi:hypothetical protein
MTAKEELLKVEAKDGRDGGVVVATLPCLTDMAAAHAGIREREKGEGNRERWMSCRRSSRRCRRRRRLWDDEDEKIRGRRGGDDIAANEIERRRFA